jgi:glycosyltransferase involved in cell wall biosynthesis
VKVGIYSPNAAPDLGGGYTYEQDLMEALAEAAPASRHTFAFIGRDISVDVGPIRRTALRLTETVHRVVPRVPDYRDRHMARRLVSHGIECVWYLTPCALTLDVPYIATVFDLQHRRQPFFPEVSSMGVWEAREAFYRSYLQRAAAVITGNEVGRAEIERYYAVPPERIHLLPHPTPRFALSALANAGSGVTKKYGLQPGYLLYPAQFWPHKNHATLLHALRHLPEPRPQLVLVGADKGNREYVKRLASELGVSANVLFLGFVPREDLIGLYRQALALTYVTLFGPENLPPLEAFALGCPVIASDVAGAREQLGDAAVLVPPTDALRLAEAIRSFQTDSALRDCLISRGKVRAASFASREYVAGALRILDGIEELRRTWESQAMLSESRRVDLRGNASTV